MQIGEFARICDTKITILRHYDKEGLLEPDYVDTFTGYRYYSDAQIPIFFRITALKKAGFSLAEIKEILASGENNDAILSLFEKKQAELLRMVDELEEARKIILKEKASFEISFSEENGTIWAKSTIFNANYLSQAQRMMDSTLGAKRYQRVSSYRVQSIPNAAGTYLVCEVIRLRSYAMNIYDPISIPFENDEAVIGKWEIAGEYICKEDFFSGFSKGDPTISGQLREIYFLPEGRRYWCYGWTKGYLLCSSYGGTTANRYTVERIGDAFYMFVELKSYEYRYGGNPTILVLKQIDRRAYREEEIRKRDDVDKPFVLDPRILGNWKVFGFTKTVESFDPAKKQTDMFPLVALSFAENGEVLLFHRRLQEEMGVKETCLWTTDFLLRKSLAHAYELHTIEGREYLFLEWKSGDYVYGGLEPPYYVFIRG